MKSNLDSGCSPTREIRGRVRKYSRWIHRANWFQLADRIHVSFDVDIGQRVEEFRVSRWIGKNVGRRPSLRFSRYFIDNWAEGMGS